MVTRYYRLSVLTIYFLSKNKRKISLFFFHLKITIFTAVKYYSILQLQIRKCVTDIIQDKMASLAKTTKEIHHSI